MIAEGKRKAVFELCEGRQGTEGEGKEGMGDAGINRG